ncbi:hypothetical protein T265_05369 [Opisthorchis viverrini]|uniref:Uncharacterized protein n=1 Tax=Opisthorchis viverrini TaxID=6198 RepID=A0A074ZPE2_OPIVI|nr:hypothetical protein T265_05369 [Opisthorchis viverrini]KER27652.1 hypothetical protein T265_05369 [Opisthorchis viverrini]
MAFVQHFQLKKNITSERFSWGSGDFRENQTVMQIHRWGEVPSHHDVEMAELKARVSAAVFFVLATHCRRNVKEKLNLRKLT